MNRVAELLAQADQVTGFMPSDEGRALFDNALLHGARKPNGTWLEIGAYCGKSSIYLGAAAEQGSCLLYSLDHHHGSEENQAGWPYHDPTLVDLEDGRLNTLPHWQRNIAKARLEDSVVALVGESSIIAKHFAQPLDLLFIDGGHGHDVAWRDFQLWARKITVGGFLIIHDVFANPADGGQVPYEIYRTAVQSGVFVDVAEVGSLRVTVRIR